MLHARGDICLFTDADLSSPISEAPKLFDAISAGADIAIGSRWLRPDLQTDRQPLYRQAFGRIFNVVLRVFLGLNFADTQCGFKAFRREAAQRIFPLQKIERWGFDPEILFLARRMNFTVKEVPVVWAHNEGTRLHPFRDGFRMFLEVLRIRWNSISGAYTAAAVPSPRKPAPGKL
jgi:glycosyltransferase involved in cell wall biosynthesis